MLKQTEEKIKKYEHTSEIKAFLLGNEFDLNKFKINIKRKLL